MSEFKRITADEAGISPASLAELYQKLEDPGLGLHSFLVYKNGGLRRKLTGSLTGGNWATRCFPPAKPIPALR